MTKNRTQFKSGILRLDGYYYWLETGGREDYLEAFFLNSNGIYFQISQGSFAPKLSLELMLIELDNKIKYKVENIDYSDSRPFWGVFSVEGSLIEIQHWEFAAGGGAYPTRSLEGTVINDTTILFHNLIGAYPNNKGGRKKEKAIDDTYYFRKFSPKPDSTNTFIK